MNPRVSVVIPNYNNAKFLNECIDSVLIQTFKPIEIIVVDDGSSDDSIQILEDYGTKIKLIKSGHCGASRARNLGMQIATGELIALLDSDDYWNAEKLADQVEYLEANDLDLVYCGGRSFNYVEKKVREFEPVYSGKVLMEFHKNPTSAIIVLGCSSAIFRKSLLKYSGLFDEEFKNASEDWDFFRRYCSFANVGFVKEKHVNYRIHETNLSSSSLVQYYEGNVRAVEKMLIDHEGKDSASSNRIWTKLYFSYAVAFMKNWQLLASALCLTKGIYRWSMRFH
jgi:glycosyltransferase involved in cell wall biosynthesis